LNIPNNIGNFLQEKRIFILPCISPRLTVYEMQVYNTH